MNIDARTWLRLISKFVVTDGCWLWTASKNNRGYGTFRLAGRTVQAHRLVYELLVGPIVDGLTIDHLCRNRACVRPSHLEAVSHQENCARGGRGRLRPGKTSRFSGVRWHQGAWEAWATVAGRQQYLGRFTDEEEAARTAAAGVAA